MLSDSESLDLLNGTYPAMECFEHASQPSKLKDRLTMSKRDTGTPTSTAWREIVPWWKLAIAFALALSVLGAVGFFFDGEGIAGLTFGLGLALIPVLYLSHQHRKALTSDSITGAQISRNWLLVGIPVLAALVLGCEPLDDTSKPLRDPDAVMIDVIGQMLDDAKENLKALEVKVKTIDDTGGGRSVILSKNWTVTSQSVAAGDVLGDRTEVELGVVKTGENKKPDMPDNAVVQPVEQERQEPASNTPVGDRDREVAEESFILYLDLNNIPYGGDRDTAIHSGRLTCDYISSGKSPEFGVSVSIRTAQESGYTRRQAEQIVGSAVGAFCEEYLYALN
ncbi:hypothetical protein B2J88_43295 [Rhodococcus sp. SRB_17]|nr:hypothetical protein [Rhodococcus sp. SRB_17]